MANHIKPKKENAVSENTQNQIGNILQLGTMSKSTIEKENVISENIQNQIGVGDNNIKSPEKEKKDSELFPISFRMSKEDKETYKKFFSENGLSFSEGILLALSYLKKQVDSKDIELSSKKVTNATIKNLK